MSSTLTSSTSFSDVMKQVYEPIMRDLSVEESELWDLFTEQEDFPVTEGLDGKQINLSHVFSYGGGVGPMGEDDYLYDSTDPDIKQSHINVKQWTAAVEMSGRVMRRVRQGPAAFASWAEDILPKRVKHLAFQKDVALMGSGTGILFQVNMATPASTALAINNAHGVSGLTGATFNVWLGDKLRFASDAAGATLRTGAAVVKKVNFAAGTIDIDALPTSLATGDYAALGTANTTAFGSKANMGLLGIVDDGTILSTFQGLSRSTYQQLNAHIVDSASVVQGNGGQFSEDLLEYASRIAYERGLADPDVIVCSRSSRSAYWKDLKADRRINDPAGTYRGGMGSGLSVILGDKEVPLHVVRKCPESIAFMLKRDSLKRFVTTPGRWDDTTGSIWNRVTDSTGRKDAFYATYLEEFEVASSAPNQNVKITGLVSA